ncbi:sulfatase-like hydrolase/transferase [Mesonia sp. JHPTF-M18]|uniref:Sulfatase-like hydrolase/transferase n=2 Tax=Mesonia aestuariivivens TaxID=2796128 RepID=A0ABS6W655_9FLAO|nr:sulfatase-like hydrolase/transferase [Mesonia aestuariivivens]
MSHLDDAIGQVLKRLDSLGLRKNTIVLFMSDNGAQENWHPTSQYEGKYGPNDQLGSNQPLRNYKTSNYEGAIRVPAIISWNNNFMQAEKNHNYTSVIDVMPTFLELAAVKIPEQVEGESLTVILKEKTNEHHSIYVRGHKQESLIQRPWKLVRTRHLHAKTEFELFNVEEDPSEENNVIQQYPTIAEKMKQAIAKQFSKDAKEVNVPLR